jgi:nifR3 family TIM-barrel protein
MHDGNKLKLMVKTFMETEPVFYVGPVPVYGRAILAPMDGYSDLPFRVLARELGSAMSYTEFINAGDIIHGKRPRFEERLAYLEKERPIVYQIYDDNPQRLLKAALILEKRGPDIIDVNMGCPAKTVSNRGAGAGLLKEPAKIAEIFKLLTGALKIPVTGKIRLGWDETCFNYLDVAKIVEDNGGKLLAVHARTRVQGYRGEANWDAIAEIKQRVSIPVIGNGDVRRAADVERMRAHTGCDGVMIGRGAMLNPWIFSGMERMEVSQEQMLRSAQRHLELSIQHYGPERGLLLFRKFIKSYTSVFVLDKPVRLKLVTTSELDAFQTLLQDIFSKRLDYQVGIA